MHSDLNLPVHPSMRHPLTGEPLRAVWVRPDGRICWPILGGAPDPDPTPDPKPDPAPDPKPDPAPDPKPDPAPDPGDLGFPKDTPVAQMKPGEQAAYWQHQARKHEGRNKEWLDAAGGKTAAEVAAERKELETLRQSKMSDGEKAVAEATAKGRREAALALAPQMFDVALSHVAEDRRKVLIDSIDLSKVITESGAVDTDKVKTIAETLAPAGKEGEGRRRDFGAGDRRTDKTSGVAAGRELFKERRGGKPEPKSTTSS